MSKCWSLVLGVQKLLVRNSEADQVLALGQRTHEVLKRCDVEITSAKFYSLRAVQSGFRA